MATETIADIVREMREQGRYNKENGDLDWLTEEVGDLQLRIADRIEAAVKRETVTDCNGLNEDGDWLNQLVNLINGEIAHYMSQGADCFSVDCGPWHIQYDKARE